MFKIGDFSKLASISVRMLRHYNKIELLIPEVVDADSGYRYYSAQQLQTINQIKTLRDMGFSLGIIKEIIETNADVDILKKYFAQREAELKAELTALNQQNNMLESALKQLKENTFKMNYHVQLKELPARKVISVRQQIPNFESEGKLWTILAAEATKQQVKFSSNPYTMAIFHDQEYQETEIDVEIQMAIEGQFKEEAQVKCFEAPVVKVASVMMNGSYEQVTAITETVAQWIEENDYQLDGPMFNIYHVSPGEEIDSDQWVTEVCFPVNCFE
ncbi:MerR family transcriptional regulator [Isobaculum melis]|uniref:DNA-binding transcriptional regulator, MerR family n=1 Tax=Isobaculum melis TaxID=142588 RepID=A0A1H9ST17_9LACT|nr:MerR family transcriptional regulator [Isobaculum melis]SER87985.1 DNA-binding transcriptional regulator, MerR family [Isobaculum melis]